MPWPGKEQCRLCPRGRRQHQMERPPGTVAEGDLALHVLQEVDGLVGAAARARRDGDPGHVAGVGGDGHVRLQGVRLADQLQGGYSVMSRACLNLVKVGN